MSPQYWLVKTEPEVFSFDDLWRAPKRTTAWDGVRNYQARNYLRDQMRKGDQVLVYHSSCEETGVVGLARVVREAYADPTQFQAGHVHADPASSPADPRWVCVDLQATRKLPRLVSLGSMKTDPGLDGMLLLQKGSRLSVQPVSEAHWQRVLDLGLDNRS